jgi:hypothetical protein
MGIFAEQEPFDIGLDDGGRPQFSFNVMARSRPSASFTSDIVGLLMGVGVGVRGTDIFESSAARLPPNDSALAFLTVRSTGGLAPMGTHNEAPPAWDRQPAAQIIATARTSEAALALAVAAYNAVAVRSIEISA